MENVPTPARAVFDEVYTSRTAPWVIGEPQPAIVALQRSGWIRGKVLDPGCGTGEHTIHLTALGYDVRGIDSSEHAIEQARANAAQRNVTARFEVADALQLSPDPTYDDLTYDLTYDTVIREAFSEGWILADLRPSQYRGVIVEQWLRDGCPEEFADWRIELLAVSVDGPGSLPPTDTFRQITGRPPRTFAQWALDHAADFRPPARTERRHDHPY